MPLKTFFNLKEERQKEIIDVCLEAFAFNDYPDVSLTDIIQKLGLAKGSFYRYFESKRDLYEYLIEYDKQFNRGLFESIFKEPLDDIFDAWVRFFLAAARLDNEYPVLGAFGQKISQERNNIVMGNVILSSKKKGIQILKKFFSAQQKEGKIRQDLDIGLMIYSLLHLQFGIMDYLAIKYNIDFDKNVKQGKPLFPLSEKKLKKELNQFADIMRRGIGRMNE